jgi:hypothetical protein
MMINHVTAVNGGLILSYGLDQLGSGKSAKRIANMICEFGLAEKVSLSGALYFSSHHGFDEDDSAMKLWNESLRLAELGGL